MALKRGFDSVKQKAGKMARRHIASCQSCIDYYEDKGEAEKTCHNSDSTFFDLVTDEENGREYCSYWRCTKNSEESGW